MSTARACDRRAARSAAPIWPATAGVRNSFSRASSTRPRARNYLPFRSWPVQADTARVRSGHVRFAPIRPGGPGMAERKKLERSGWTAAALGKTDPPPAPAARQRQRRPPPSRRRRAPGRDRPLRSSPAPATTARMPTPTAWAAGAMLGHAIVETTAATPTPLAWADRFTAHLAQISGVIRTRAHVPDRRPAYSMYQPPLWV